MTNDKFSKVVLGISMSVITGAYLVFTGVMLKRQKKADEIYEKAMNRLVN